MTDSIRILYLCHDGDLYGSQQSLTLLLKYLPQEEFQPFVSIARPGPLVERLEAMGHVTVLSHKRLQWFKHDRRNLWQQWGDVAGLLLGSIPKAMKIYRHIRQHDIQVVHTNSVVSLEGALAAKIAGIPHIWHIRELFMEDTPKLVPTFGRAFTRGVIHHLSSRVMCISQAVRNQFGPYLKQAPEQYQLLYNALDPEAADAPKIEVTEPELPRKTARYRIGYIGRLSEGKRFHDLLEAFIAMVNEGNVSADLVVAGNFVDAPYEQKIQGLIEDSGMKAHIHLLGYRQDLAALYTSMDVLVVPSLNEPFGRVVIEAMMAGVPCIGADSGGIPEIITHQETGLLYPPTDTQALKQLLRTALEQPELRNALLKNAGRMVGTRFTIEAQMNALIESYHAILPPIHGKNPGRNPAHARNAHHHSYSE